MTMGTTSQPNKLYLTNNYSIVSKYSASKLGYFHDATLERFIKTVMKRETDARRAPIVNRGYHARMAAIESTMSRLIMSKWVRSVIVLGSGYDMLPQRHMDKCHWIEIDLPEVIQLKREFIKSTSSAYNDCERVDRVKGIFFFRELGLTLISCDLSNYRDLCIKVDRVLHKVGCPEKICVLNEVCLSYSSEDQARSILRTVTNVDEIHDCCHYIHYVGYEPVKFIRNSQFGNIMTSHFDSMGHPLKHFPTPQQLRSLFRSLKFYELDVSSMFKMYHYHAEIEPLRAAVDGLEPFDEFEEMDLYLGHYALVTGAREMWSVINEPLDLISEDPCEDFEPISTIDEDEDGLMVLRENPVRRYGHTACLIDDSTGRQTVFVAGGFGTDHSQSTKQQHKRLSDCLLLSRESDSQDWLVTSLENRVTSTTIDPFQRMQHRLVA